MLHMLTCTLQMLSHVHGRGGGGCNNVPDYTKTVKFSYIATGGVAIIGVI